MHRNKCEGGKRKEKKYIVVHSPIRRSRCGICGWELGSLNVLRVQKEADFMA